MLSQSKINQVIASVNGFLPLTYNDCIEDFEDKHPNDPEQLKQYKIKIAYIFKNWANPEFDDQVNQDVINQLGDIKKVVDNPGQVLPGSRFSQQETRQISIIIRKKLDSMADGIFTEYSMTYHPNPKPAITARTPAINFADQQNTSSSAIRENFSGARAPLLASSANSLPSSPAANLSYSQPVLIYQPVYPERELSREYKLLSTLYDLEMFNLQLNCLRLTAELSAHTLASAGRGVISSATWGSSLVTKPSFKDTDKDTAVAILAVIGFAVMGGSAFFAMAYTLKKMAKSFANLFDGEKVLRSIFRITAGVAGAAGGEMAGAALGALLGSAIPGLGTFAGAIIGAVAGAMIGAGVATFLAKETARLISWKYYGNTNGEMWGCSTSQIMNMKKIHIDVNKFKSTLRDIQREIKFLPKQQRNYYKRDYYKCQLSLIKQGKLDTLTTRGQVIDLKEQPNTHIYQRN